MSLLARRNIRVLKLFAIAVIFLLLQLCYLTQFKGRKPAFEWKKESVKGVKVFNRYEESSFGNNIEVVVDDEMAEEKLSRFEIKM